MADVRFALSVQEQFDDLPADLRERVKDKLRDAGDPPDHYLKRLSNRDDYTLRIGDYRAIIEWDKVGGVLYVTDCDHRDGVYD